MSSDPLLVYRKEFPILEKSVYMISHSLGAMPARVTEQMNRFTDMWATRGIRAWEEGWWQMPVSVGDLIGRIIGADPGEVTMQQNVSIAQWIVHSCFEWNQGKRNKIVSESMNFPTNLYNFHEISGARLVFVGSEDGGVTIPLDRLLDAIDEETALVSVSHVLFRSSFLQDLKAIVEKAHRVGAMVCADIYQSAGTVPLNVRELNVDFAVGGSVKWLCGGPGNGYLYVRRDLWPALKPRLTGWSAHRNPFAFADGPIDYADDAYRFQHGTPNVPAMFAGIAGYEIVAEAGVERIRAKSQRQTQRLIELADAAGFRLNSPRDPAQRGGVVVMDVPNGYEVVKDLSRRDILVDFRPGAGIRVAPHFYTTDEEVEVVMHEIVTTSERLSTALTPA
jgi:kynureninase